MIKLEDKSLPYILKLNRPELVTFLMFSRYFTMKEKIPLDHIQKLSNQDDIMFASTLVTLIEHGLISFDIFRRKNLVSEIIEFAAHKRELADSDKDHDSGLRLVCGSRTLTKSLEIVIRRENGQNRERDIYFYIYNINKEYKLRNNIQINQVRPDVTGLTRKRNDVTQKFRRALTSLKGLRDSHLANQLVTHFASVSLNVLPDLERNNKWRLAQHSIAKRLLRDYSYNIDIWKEAVSFFFKQEFWRDKLNSLLTIEKHMNQFIGHKNKTENTNVELIK